MKSFMESGFIEAGLPLMTGITVVRLWRAHGGQTRHPARCRHCAGSNRAVYAAVTGLASEQAAGVDAVGLFVTIAPTQKSTLADSLIVRAAPSVR
jgi:hypothetical protein